MKMNIKIIALIACLMVPMFLVGSVKAKKGPIFSPEPRHIFYPYFVKNNGLLLDGPWSQPYMAGYMTNDSLSGNPGRVPGGAVAVNVTVSFSGTDNSIIQDGNALAAGIAAQGPSTCGSIVPVEPWIDYGYTLLLVVDNAYDWPFIQGIVWEVCEYGLFNLWPVEDPVVTMIDGFTWENPQVLTMDSEVTLTMEWSSNLLFYSATIEGVEYPLYIHFPNEIQLQYFMLGTAEREHKLEPLVDLPGTVKWFQFPGAWSNNNIGQVGWHSYLSYPSFIMKGESSWTNVPFAYSVNGTTSWLDNTVNWGGACYDNVNADYTHQHVHFYPTYETTIEPDTLLWSPPVCAMKTRKTDGAFYVPYVASSLLKIEMLFNDADIEGDQTGGTSPYGTINHYPDGTVNIIDVSFISGVAWGSHEGDENWDYMADVVPNKVIDILDVSVAARNFGKSGTYITSLAGVAVTFNVGGTKTPDDDGFVTIPQDATSFTVKRYGTSIGAMIIFW